jgi:hypothetical protein
MERNIVHKWEDIIKLDLKDEQWKGFPAQDGARKRVLVITVMQLIVCDQLIHLQLIKKE